MNVELSQESIDFFSQYPQLDTNFAYEVDKKGNMYPSKGFSNEGKTSKEAAEKIFEQIKSYLDNRLGTIYWRRPLDVVEENGRNFTASCRITFVPSLHEA